MAGQVTPLPKQSDEFARVEYLLQLSCRSTAVKDVSIWSISNPHVAIQFERASQGLLCLDCWVDVTALDENNAIQDVCKRGFVVPESGEGLPFLTGNIRFDADGPETHQYLLCTVAVGRSYVLDDAAGGARTLPPGGGFQSAYLHTPDGGSSGVGGDDPGAGYRHTYVVFNGAQVLPRYVTHFCFAPADARVRAPLSSINLSDIKARVSDALSVLGPAAGAATERLLTEIGDSYERALNASSEEDPLLGERRRAVRELLRGVDDKLRAVQVNAAAVEEALYGALQAALGALQDAAGAKLNTLLAEELELRRQLAQIDWAESFVGTLQDTLPPVSFIAAWERHGALRAALAAQQGGGALAGGGPGGAGGGGLGSTRATIDAVQADLRLIGRLDVVAGGAGAASSSQQPLGAFGAGLLGGGGGGSATVGGPASRVYGLAPPAAAAAAAAPSPAAAPPSPAPAAALGDAAAAPSPAQSVGDLWTTVLRQTMGMPQAAPPPTAAVAAPAAAQSPAAFGGGGGGPATPAHGGASTPAQPPPASAVRQTPAAAPSATPASAAPPAAAAAAASSAAAAAPPGASASLGDRLARYSLRREAERHRRQRGIDGDGIDPDLAFAGSRVLPSFADAVALYLALPWGSATAPGAAGGEDEYSGGAAPGAPVPPMTRLLYSSLAEAEADADAGSAAPADRAPPLSLRAIAERYSAEGGGEPTVVLVRAAATGAVFGGFAADGWDFSGLFGGRSPRSFLFSVTRDVKVPYTGRTRGPRQPNDDFLRQAHEYEQAQIQTRYAEALAAASEQVGGGPPPFDDAGNLLLMQLDEDGNMVAPIAVPAPRPKPFVRLDCLRSDADTLQWGLADLVLAGDLSACSSELETSYGVGLKPGSVDARTLLAGAPVFAVDAIEVWTVAPPGAGAPGAADGVGAGAGGDGFDGGYDDGGYGGDAY